MSGQAATLASLRDIAIDDPNAVGFVQQLEDAVPDHEPLFEWIWRAWHRLSDDRPRYGGGLGPSVPGRIPWTVVRAWGRHHRLSRAELDLLDHCFGVMDAAYIAWWLSQQATPEP